jgi:hypothetical protein
MWILEVEAPYVCLLAMPLLGILHGFRYVMDKGA